MSYFLYQFPEMQLLYITQIYQQFLNTYTFLLTEVTSPSWPPRKTFCLLSFYIFFTGPLCKDWRPELGGESEIEWLLTMLVQLAQEKLELCVTHPHLPKLSRLECDFLCYFSLYFLFRNFIGRDGNNFPVTNCLPMLLEIHTLFPQCYSYMQFIKSMSKESETMYHFNTFLNHIQ